MDSFLLSASTGASCLCSAGPLTPEELNPSQDLLEETLIQRLLEYLPDTIHPLLLADLGFRRASLLLLLGMEYYLVTPEPPPRWLGLPAS